MKAQDLTCGIDVSKDTLDLYYNDSDGKEHYFKVSNDQKGHDMLLDKLGLKRTCLMESSGPYYLKLAFTIKNLDGDVRVENPIAVKRFIQMHLERNKSDKKDARWLYFYARQQQTSAWTLPPKEQLYCAQIMGSIDLYSRQLVMITNQLHSLDQVPLQMKEVIKSLKKIKSNIENEVKKLEAQLQHLLQNWQGEQLKNITSIPGLGKRAVALLIVYTEGFKKISNHRQLIALAGLAPREHTSGTSVRGRKGICKWAMATCAVCCTCAVSLPSSITRPVKNFMTG
jgi:transposase